MLTILDKLGGGTFGTVYRARDNVTGKVYAVKKIAFTSSEYSYDNDDDSEDSDIDHHIETRITSYLTEVVFLKYVCYTTRNNAGLYNTLNCIDRNFVEYSGGYYQGIIVFPQAQGSLNAVYKEYKLPKRLEFIISVHHAIEWLHSIGICHGDVKPPNMIVIDDVVKLIDFGTAYAADIYVREQLSIRAKVENIKIKKVYNKHIVPDASMFTVAYQADRWASYWLPILIAASQKPFGNPKEYPVFKYHNDANFMIGASNDLFGLALTAIMLLGEIDNPYIPPSITSKDDLQSYLCSLATKTEDTIEAKTVDQLDDYIQQLDALGKLHDEDVELLLHNYMNYRQLLTDSLCYLLGLHQVDGKWILAKEYYKGYIQHMYFDEFLQTMQDIQQLIQVKKKKKT